MICVEGRATGDEPAALLADRLASAIKRKEPPGNRAAPSSGRIVPTEARPSELSGCIVGGAGGCVKNKSDKY